MYNIGEAVVHPMHGAGVITDIEEAKIGGEIIRYYVISIPIGEMLVKVPVDHCDEVGMRPVISPETADEMLVKMQNVDGVQTSNWNKRYRENVMHIKSGNILEVASVIKGLAHRDATKGLSTGERKMLYTARQIIVSEFMLSKQLGFDEVTKTIDGILGVKAG